MNTQFDSMYFIFILFSVCFVWCVSQCMSIRHKLLHCIAHKNCACRLGKKWQKIISGTKEQYISNAIHACKTSLDGDGTPSTGRCYVLWASSTAEQQQQQQPQFVLRWSQSRLINAGIDYVGQGGGVVHSSKHSSNEIKIIALVADDKHTNDSAPMNGFSDIRFSLFPLVRFFLFIWCWLPYARQL